MSIRSARLFLLVALTFALSTVARAEIFFAYLTPAQENPPVASSGTGYARVFLNESAGTLNFTLVFNNMTSNQILSHIHTGAIGVNGPITIDFGTVGGTSGTITGSRSITPAQIITLRQHGMYVNVHSANFTGGELRGQLGSKRPVDFDGDGRNDLSILRFPTTGDPRPITFWNMNSTTGLQLATFGNALTDFPAPGDYDGDGKDDFALYRSGSATLGPQSNYFILRSSDSTVQHYAWGLQGDLNVARDYDGDGITDVATFRRGAVVGGQATWYIRRSTNNTAQVVGFGMLGSGANNQDFPVPADYDGDGKYDIAVYRAGTLTPTNTYIVLQSSNGVITYRQFGNFVTDWIVPGDYDGDGKADYAVGRTGGTAATPMVWWILQSSNGATRTQVFGLSSDTPAQGDYDGDARTDVALVRPGTAATLPHVFWILNSFDNTVTNTRWGVNPDFVLNTFDTR